MGFYNNIPPTFKDLEEIINERFNKYVLPGTKIIKGSYKIEYVRDNKYYIRIRKTRTTEPYKKEDIISINKNDLEQLYIDIRLYNQSYLAIGQQYNGDIYITLLRANDGNIRYTISGRKITTYNASLIESKVQNTISDENIF